MARIAVLIADLDRPEDTIKAVRSVLMNTRMVVSVYVWLNGGDRACSGRLYCEFAEDARVHICGAGQNLGFTGAHNCLLEVMRERNDQVDAVVFLNNDAIVEKEALDTLFMSLEQYGEAGIAGPRILDMLSDVVLEDGVRVLPLLFQHIAINRGRRREECPPPPVSRVRVVIGTCMMVKYPVIARLGGFDGRYFAYFEDWDLCLRCEAMGYVCLHVSTAVIRHAESLTLGKDSDMRHYLLTRNRWMLARQHASSAVFWTVFVPWFLLMRVVVQTIMLAVSGRRAALRGVWRGVSWIVGSPAQGTSVQAQVTTCAVDRKARQSS